MTIMANMPNDFWSGWIIVLSVVGFLSLLWLVYNIYFANNQVTPLSSAHAAPVWDDDLQEGDHPAPMWWFWMILAAMVFSVMYLMLYPGLGSFAGALGWSQPGQLHQHQALATERVAPKQEYVQRAGYEVLANDPVAMNSAERLFIDNCAACHGRDALGQANSYPNLRDGDWLWGGTPEQIEQTIRNGRNAVMVSWQPILGDSGVNDVANYVVHMRSPEAETLPGKAVYSQYCIACHGLDGSGNPLLGAPRLNDDIWLYGGSEEVVRTTVAGGRNGQMPAFATRFSDNEIKLLVAWLLRGA
jgi:cytochrome c oxidase cbb3-type subunit III